MPSLKKLLEEYKKIDKDFRAEYDGETWNIWYGHSRDYGNPPSYPNITSDQLTKMLKNNLMQAINKCEKEAATLTQKAQQLRFIVYS